VSSVGIRFACALLAGSMGLAVWSSAPADAQESEDAPQQVPAEAAAEDLAPAVPESELREPAAEEFEPAAPELESVAPEEPSFAGIEEITITSQGREQTSQEAVISVAAFDADYLDALGARDISDVSQFTPNLEIRSPLSASTPTLFIRGVGLRDFNANSSSSVAVYNDDVYMNSPAGQLSQLFDIEQLEILRGPQGALYGRNASAGAIRVISRKPRGNEVTGFVDATYGRFDQIDLEGAFEVPLRSDLLSMRISGVMHLRDGHTTNRCADDDYWRSAVAPAPGEQRSFEWDVFTSCFNPASRDPLQFIGTRTPVDLGGQGWDAGSLDPLASIGSAANAVVPSDIERKVNDVDNWAGRGLLRLQPTGGSDWIFNVHGSRNRALARQFQMMAYQVVPRTGETEPTTGDQDDYNDSDTIRYRPNSPTQRCVYPDPCALTEPEQGDAFAGEYNNTGPERVDRLGGNLSGDIPVGDGSLSIRSITAYEWNERLVVSNVDGSPHIGLEIDFGNEAWQASQEFKAFWDAGGQWSWQAGLTFLYEDLDVLNDFGLSPRVTSRQDYRQQTYYGSAYGYFAWLPVDEFSVEGGLRWNVEHKDFEITATRLNLAGEPTASVTQQADITEQAPSGDISIHYRPYEDVNFYAKYSRGWKGPHFNGTVLTTDPDRAQNLVVPVEPENVNALEIGLKSMWLDNRLRVNTAAFYYDYENIQIFQVRNAQGGAPVQELINANDADVYGVEFEVETQPFQGWAPAYLEGLTLFGSFAWLESQYTDFINQRVSVTGGQTVVRTEDFSGNRLINAPRLAFTGFALWEWTLGRYGMLIPRLDWSFKDQVFFSPENIDPVSQDALWLLNARLAYRTPNEMIEVAGWVRNLTDEVYRLDVINLTRFRDSILYAMGDPRTYGISLSVSF
jgi:iron complex outermembrane receptor protein